MIYNLVLPTYPLNILSQGNPREPHFLCYVMGPNYTCSADRTGPWEAQMGQWGRREGGRHNAHVVNIMSRPRLPLSGLVPSAFFPFCTPALSLFSENNVIIKKCILNVAIIYLYPFLCFQQGWNLMTIIGTGRGLLLVDPGITPRWGGRGAWRSGSPLPLSYILGN